MEERLPLDAGTVQAWISTVEGNADEMEKLQITPHECRVSVHEISEAGLQTRIKLTHIWTDEEYGPKPTVATYDFDFEWLGVNHFKMTMPELPLELHAAAQYALAQKWAAAICNRLDRPKALYQALTDAKRRSVISAILKMPGLTANKVSDYLEENHSTAALNEMETLPTDRKSRQYLVGAVRVLKEMSRSMEIPEYHALPDCAMKNLLETSALVDSFLLSGGGAKPYACYVENVLNSMPMRVLNDCHDHFLDEETPGASATETSATGASG